MVFKRMLRAFGVGGPSVDTVLANPDVRPGEALTGEVRVAGGDHRADIDHVALSLVTRVEVEHHDGEHDSMVEFHRFAVAHRLTVQPGEHRVIPFQFPVPVETPLTHVGGHPLSGMTLGLRTELAITGAVDKGDHDPVAVHPLHSQQRVLDAFGQLGFRFARADVEAGRLHGVHHQQLPFFQEIEFYPPSSLAGRVNQVELTFVADHHSLHVILEADRRGGLFRSGGDSFGHFHLSHDEVMSADWAAIIHSWMSEVVDRHGAHVPQVHGHHDEHRGHHGPGIGAAAGGVAVGFVGGMILGEVFDEVGDFFEAD
ncbi:MAG TPA: sporulation protein [Pseudonocardiaceae bacterium]|nr:sporulation protein [Pseudonocardiaceae bacterium]